MDYPALLSFGGAILGIVGGAVGLYGKISGRFSSLENSITESRGRDDLLKAQIEDIRDEMLTLKNGVKEQVDHARNRFFYEFERSNSQYEKEMKELHRQVSEVRQFLAKSTEFKEREYRDG